MKPTLEISAKILLIDDSRNGLLVRTALLQEMGCAVKIANNGEEGLRLFKSDPFDMIVADYHMAGMKGPELIGRIRQIQPHARIIVLSNIAEPLGLNEENTGADAVIGKNCNEVFLLPRAVKRLLNRPARKPVGSHRQTTLKVSVGAR